MIRPGFATIKISSNRSTTRQNFLLRAQITAQQQAGRWRDVIPAVNAARAAGLAPSVFVYSKVVSILVRAKQIELAMQQFEQMQSERTKADLVLFNTLLDACAQRGMADKAMQLLQQMTAAGDIPNVISYNAVINACSKGGQYAVRLQLMFEMKAAMLVPDVQSYNTLINVCSKGGQYETAIELLSEMKTVGLQPNEVSYTATIDACSKAKQYETAIELLSEMNAVGLKPDVITYTAVIDACKNTGNWQHVLDLTKQMKADGIIPNILTYTTAIDALQAGEQYHAADVLCAEVLSGGFLQHWSVKRKGMLDFHKYSTGMTLAAMRLVLRDVCTYNIQPDSKHYVHDPTTDLVIITGHANSRQDQDGSILQPCIVGYCKELGIVCTVIPTNKGRLVITAAQLQLFGARQAADMM
jgi:pentatricopeptide repeat protein